MANPQQPLIERFPTAKQRLMDQLLDKNAEGSITPLERKSLEQLVAEAEELIAKNAKTLVK